MGRPALFNAVSSIYFACVSFQETKRRLGHSSLESSFLLGDEPSLSSRIDKCLNQLETLASISPLSGEQQFEWVQKALTCIEPFNVIGIGDESRGNWYPVDMKDLFDCCGKLPASPGEITGMLQRLGLAP